MEDIFIYIKKVMFYFLWCCPIFLLEVDAVIDFFLHKWKKFREEFIKKYRKKLILILFFIGFIISNYFAFHDAMNEKREIQNNFNLYKEQYLGGTEKVKKWVVSRRELC